MKYPYFILLDKILFEVFSTLNIANSVLQGRDSNLKSAMQTIEECRVDIEDFHVYSIDKITKDLETMRSLYTEKGSFAKEKRQTSLPKCLSGSIVDDRIPSQIQRMPGAIDLWQTVVEVCNVLSEELSRRFGGENTSIWVAIHALSP